MGTLWMVRSGEHPRWRTIINRAWQYDFYHLPEFHALAEERGEGEARLFVYTEMPYVIALPLLLRPLVDVPGLEVSGKGWWDAGSVYGAAGPIASHAQIPQTTICNFQAALHEFLRDYRVVSVFSRLHPCMPQQQQLLAGLGTTITLGQTVSIDLTLPVDVQRSRYRKNHKHGINKLRSLGVTCVFDEDGSYLDAFIDMYYQTMMRVGASNSYFFEQPYFERLLTTPDLQMHLFVCLLDDTPVCGGVFSLCGDIVQYYLGGTHSDYLSLAPMKLLFDTVRLWATEQGAKRFHLGGGVGVRNDSLFQFKAGFSDDRHDCGIWRWVLMADVYEQLCADKEHWNRQNGLVADDEGYFPAYRSPAVPALDEIQVGAS